MLLLLAIVIIASVNFHCIAYHVSVSSSIKMQNDARGHLATSPAALLSSSISILQMFSIMSCVLCAVYGLYVHPL